MIDKYQMLRYGILYLQLPSYSYFQIKVKIYKLHSEIVAV